MSDLEALCATLDAINGDINRMAQELHGKAQQYSRAAASAAAAARSAEGEAAAALARTAVALSAAAQHSSRAAQSLAGASSEGRAFVQRTVGGGGSEGGSARGEASPAALSNAQPSDDGRYVSPDNQARSVFASLVDAFGRENPDGWIQEGNLPRYRSGDERWTNNCGPCSRAFADTLQGVSTEPALGDTKIPPGEYQEMWDAVGARPATSARNDNFQSAEAFTQSAYARLAQGLASASPGSVAIIGVNWQLEGVPRELSGGHWFNAYVGKDGRLYWADEQIGRHGTWPPPYSSQIWELEAVVRSNGQSSWKEVPI